MIAAPFLVPQHFGQLHAWEQSLVVLLAFGPFILLGVIVMVVRRRDIAEEEAAREAQREAQREAEPLRGDDGPGS